MYYSFLMWEMLNEFRFVCIYKHTSRRCCCSVCRCWAGWWWLTALHRCVFAPSSDAKTTAAPSVCGWSRETWVRRISQSRELQTPERLFITVLLLLLLCAVLADPRYWLMELSPSGAQRVLCDGPVLWDPDAAGSDVSSSFFSDAAELLWCLLTRSLANFKETVLCWKKRTLFSWPLSAFRPHYWDAKNYRSHYCDDTMNVNI